MVEVWEVGKFCNLDALVQKVQFGLILHWGCIGVHFATISMIIVACFLYALSAYLSGMSQYRWRWRRSRWPWQWHQPHGFYGVLSYFRLFIVWLVNICAIFVPFHGCRLLHWMTWTNLPWFLPLGVTAWNSGFQVGHLHLLVEVDSH